MTPLKKTTFFCEEAEIELMNRIDDFIKLPEAEKNIDLICDIVNNYNYYTTRKSFMVGISAAMQFVLEACRYELL